MNNKRIMHTEKVNIIELYQKRAKYYDFTANIYYLIGFREYAYRKKAVSMLNLKKGDTVIELCCGTGLNFPFLQEKVGPEGKIIGVDMTNSMLVKAKNKIDSFGWKNVKLVNKDIAEFNFPNKVDGILSTLGITLCPEYDLVIKRGRRALSSGKRFVILDLKSPFNLLSRFTLLAILITKPFGVRKELAKRRPWESLHKYFKKFCLKHFYGGFVYIASGEK